MDKKRSFRLIDAVLLLFALLLPALLLLGLMEGTTARPGWLFWLLLFLPILVLPWLLACCAPEDTADGHRVTAQTIEHEHTSAAGFERLVEPEIDVRRVYVDKGVAAAEGVLRVDSAQAFAQLERRFRDTRIMPLLESVENGGVRVLALPRAMERRDAPRSPAVQIALFLATVVTTVYAGALQRNVNLLEDPNLFMAGVPFAAALLGILGVHEMGHYVAARRHGVEVTLPYFIPVPMGLGTFGAFIQIKSLIKSRRALFDIGIAGPLAGLCVALPALYFGLNSSVALADSSPGAGLQTGSSLMLALLYQSVHGGELGDAAVRLSPVASAGWVGLFVTALNLLPIGQLDGGHIAYGLFGRRHAKTIGVLSIIGMMALGLSVWPGLLTWALLVTLLAGFAHLPSLDDVTPPDGKRFVLGAVALAMLVMIVLPVPSGLRMFLDSPYQ